MTSFGLGDSRYFNKLQVNRLSVNSVKINELNVNEENLVPYKSVDTLIEEFDKNDLILVTQKCLNRIKTDFATKSAQHSNYDKILLYENELLLPTYRSVVSFYVNNMIKVDDTTYSLDVEKDSIKSIIHNDFVEKSLIMSVHSDFNSIKDESVKDFQKFCVNSGLNGPGVVEIYAGQKAYIGFIRKFHSYNDIEISFINTHKDNFNEVNFHHTNENVIVDIEDFNNKFVNMSIGKSIYNSNVSSILKWIAIGITVACAAVATVIPGVGELVDTAEAGFLDAELTTDAVNDIATVGTETASTVTDESTVAVEASTSESSLTSTGISESIDDEVEDSFNTAFKDFGTELKQQLKIIAKNQVKKWLKSKIKIAFKKALLKGTQSMINSLIFHGIEYAYAVAVLGKTTHELETNNNWTDHLPKWLTDLSSIHFIQIQSDAQAKHVKIVINKRAVKKALKNTVKTIGKEKLNEIFDSATGELNTKLSILKKGISINKQDKLLNTPIKAHEKIDMNNIHRLHLTHIRTFITFTNLSDPTIKVKFRYLDISCESYNQKYVLIITLDGTYEGFFEFTANGYFTWLNPESDLNHLKGDLFSATIMG